MRVAELLSDFNSLRPGICDPKAALALVTAGRKEAAGAQQDDELSRVKDLLDLHAGMKQTHTDGVDKELASARDAVHQVLQAL